MIRRTLLIAGLTLGLFAVAPMAQAQTLINFSNFGKKGGFEINYARLPIPAYPVYQQPVLPAPPVVPAPPVAPVAYPPVGPVGPIGYPPVSPVGPVAYPPAGPVGPGIAPACEVFRVIYLAPCGRWETFGVYQSHRRAHGVTAQLVARGIPARVIH
ncbi:MAG: hypothetical protein AB7K24_24180 [Gemmataceae bacterium]